MKLISEYVNSPLEIIVEKTNEIIQKIIDEVTLDPSLYKGKKLKTLKNQGFVF